MASEIIGGFGLDTGQLLRRPPVSFNGWPMGSGRSVNYSGEGVCEFTIAKIPPGGYKIDQYSKSSIQWLEWMSHHGGVRIQHALNGGERFLLGTRYKLDGFCHETNTGTSFTGAPSVSLRTEKRRNTHSHNSQ